MARARWVSFIQFLCEIYQLPEAGRQSAVDELLTTHDEWPWVERDRATFVYESLSAQSVSLNLDIVNRDPPFEKMVRLDDTSLWYFQRYFDRDALVDYMFAVDDPGTPLAQELHLMDRVASYWLADPLNSHAVSGSPVNTSVLRMPRARPFADWRAMPSVPRGKVYRHQFSSTQLAFRDRSLWIYTPPGYRVNGEVDYPLLILLDGQWALNIFEAPFIADALIKHGRMQPIIIAMVAASSQSDRVAEYVGNDKHYAMIAAELLPFLQSQHRIEPTDLGLGGVGEGAVAAIHAALKNPAIFSHLIMLSPPLGRAPASRLLRGFIERFRDSPSLPRRIFQSVGRYEHDVAFYKPAMALRDVLDSRMARDADLQYKFVELGSGHSLAAFKSIMPEALAHAFPGAAELA